MSPPLQANIRRRAGGRCEYCHLPELCSVLPHVIDHIRARQHRGLTNPWNTCLACTYCNLAKGPNAAGFDPASNELVRLFNPRSDNWGDHFRWRGAVLIGKTAIARATIEVLQINATPRINHRQLLHQAGKQFR